MTVIALVGYPQGAMIDSPQRGRRRVDRIKAILERCEGSRAKVSEIRDKLAVEESDSQLRLSSVYVAIQQENQNLSAQGKPSLFVTSQNGEARGYVRLQSDVAESDDERDLRSRIEKLNGSVDNRIRQWLGAMDWREFEDSFLTQALEKLGFQDVIITGKVCDGGVDAKVEYNRGIVRALAVVSAKHWNERSSIGSEVVQQIRGVAGSYDTAIVVTTATFTSNAKKEAERRDHPRALYLIDGESLVRICKEHSIGVKRVELPTLLTIDTELGSSSNGVDGRAPKAGASRPASAALPKHRRIRDEMMGDRERGLSLDEIAKLLGLSPTTVRVYLSQPEKKHAMAQKLRSDADKRKKALAIIAIRRSAIALANETGDE